MGVRDAFKSIFKDPQYDDDETVTKSEGEEDLFFEDNPVKQQRARSDKNDKVAIINATTQIQVVLVRPERYDDASAIADHLAEKKTVVLNLESTNKDVARRLIDFLSGVAYAHNGQLKRVANSTFIITPYNVNIMGDIIDELENNGVYF